ncbi:MAG: hypothetical protein K0R61_5211 [Microvirga sp.]|nr:hypothetical protein [Microvirga sp.]
MTDLNRVSATDIASKWSKVTHPEAAAIKSVDGLSAQVQKSYGFDKAKADAEVKQFGERRGRNTYIMSNTPLRRGADAASGNGQGHAHS